MFPRVARRDPASLRRKAFAAARCFAGHCRRDSCDCGLFSAGLRAEWEGARWQDAACCKPGQFAAAMGSGSRPCHGYGAGCERASERASVDGCGVRLPKKRRTLAVELDSRHTVCPTWFAAGGTPSPKLTRASCRACRRRPTAPHRCCWDLCWPWWRKRAWEGTGLIQRREAPRLRHTNQVTLSPASLPIACPAFLAVLLWPCSSVAANTPSRG